MTKYVVMWRYNNQNHSKKFNSITEAEMFRWQLIGEGGYLEHQISVHVKDEND